METYIKIRFAFLFLAIAIGLSAGNGVVVAQYYGARKAGYGRRASNGSTV